MSNNKKFNSKSICLVKNASLLKNNKEFLTFKYEGGSGFQTVRFILHP